MKLQQKLHYNCRVYTLVILISRSRQKNKSHVPKIAAKILGVKGLWYSRLSFVSCKYSRHCFTKLERSRVVMFFILNVKAMKIRAGNSSIVERTALV